MIPQSYCAAFETMRTLGHASIGAAYVKLGTALAHPSVCCVINNLTDDQLTYSDDGINDKFTLAPGASFTFDQRANLISLHKGMQLYVKGSPTSGSTYLTTIYAVE